MLSANRNRQAEACLQRASEAQLLLLLRSLSKS